MPNPYAAVGLFFDGVDLQRADLSLFLEIAEGLGSMPELRGVDVDRPGLPGRKARNRIPDVLPIELVGWMKEPTLSDLAVARRELLEIFRPSKGPRTLQATLEDGTIISIPARVVGGGVQYGKEGRGGTRTITCGMEATDPPYWRGAEIVVVEAVAGSPEAFVLSHPGNERTHEIVFELTGPIENPRLTNTDLGVYVEALVTLGAGEILTIDGVAFTADIDGTTAIGSIRHSGARQWMLLEPGDNAMELTGSGIGGGTSLETRFRPAYI